MGFRIKSMHFILNPILNLYFIQESLNYCRSHRCMDSTTNACESEFVQMLKVQLNLRSSMFLCYQYLCEKICAYVFVYHSSLLASDLFSYSNIQLSQFLSHAESLASYAFSFAALIGFFRLSETSCSLCIPSDGALSLCLRVGVKVECSYCLLSYINFLVHVS